jgi:hypothetical protein
LISADRWRLWHEKRQLPEVFVRKLLISWFKRSSQSREGNTEMYMYTAGLLEVVEGCKGGKKRKAKGKERKEG